MLSKEQIDYLTSMKFINSIDEKVKVIAEYEIKFLPAAPTVVGRIILILAVFYSEEKVTTMSFDLQNYNYEELLDVAKNIKRNEFIMHEMDTYLAGDEF